MAQCFRFGWRRCSPLNWTLGLGNKNSKEVPVGKKLAMLIGVSNYDNEASLEPCSRDLELMSSIINLTQKYDDCLLLNESPNSTEAKAALSSFIRKYQEDDIEEVFFYYTGHGTRYGDDFLYLFSDFSGSKIEQTSLRNSEFDSMLKSLNPDLAVKIVDACQSGTEYIKSNNDLQVVFEKSSTNNFNKTYFLFSSSNTQSSIALPDYSVFTKSFAHSLQNFEGKDIRYRDIMAYISDDVSVQKYQTPLFVQQADNTEVFCNVSELLGEKLEELLPSSSSIKLEDEEDVTEGGKSELSEDEKLIQAIRAKAKDYCNEEKCMQSLSKLIETVKAFEWSVILNELYDIEVDLETDCHKLNNTESIANWLKSNDDNYFARPTYKDEEYEVKEKVEYEPQSIRSLAMFGREKRVEYRPVTKYRKVVDGFELTAPSPGSALVVTLTPSEENLPWYQVFITFVFSKSKLTIFCKYERLKEVSWNNRKLGNSQEWQIAHCKLSDQDEIQNVMSNLLKQVESSIVKVLIKRFGE
ncbi:caspase family protein [Vibrio parahaemolyticus]|nr:caspase family protein [Vibrio parahaemolyticus]EGR3508418.1 caspase family protein [Vibrio parahaemolyticus]